ncbi:hypothetical protein BGX24_008632 [Mortierella sp. AD032]|nr:hypothetical protein BGX24_008632 [Mortierella sp. AD032]
MKNVFSDEELSELKGLFVQHDADKDGTINTAELLKITEYLETPATEDAVKAVIQQYDADNDGKLDYNEFLELMKELRNTSNE